VISSAFGCNVGGEQGGGANPMIELEFDPRSAAGIAIRLH